MANRGNTAQSEEDGKVPDIDSMMMEVDELTPPEGNTPPNSASPFTPPTTGPLIKFNVDNRRVVQWALGSDFSTWCGIKVSDLTALSGRKLGESPPPAIEFNERSSSLQISLTTGKPGSINSSGGESLVIEKLSAGGMIIEDADKFKAWLTAILQPLCDADPAALAKYVLALIKKDKPEKDLRQSMQDQLDVFLQGETPKFIERLFELLRTKDYLTKTPPPIIPKEVKEEKKMIYDVFASTSSSSQDTLSGFSNHGKDAQGEDMEVTISTENDNEAEVPPSSGDNKDDANNVEKSSGRRDRKDDDRDRSRRRRSRSPANRRFRGARSRSRGRDKKYHPRKNWRSGRRSRSRSPLGHRSNSAGRNRSRSPPPGRYRRHGSRSRSRSPKVAPSRNSPNGSEGGMKETGDKPSLQSVVVVKGGPAVEKLEQGNRCRDFDEKGLCMRGELCPFDHGADPVVLEDVVIPGVTNNSSSGQYNQPLSGDGYGAGPAANMMRPGLPSAMGEYYPDNPAMDPTWGMQFRPRMGFDPMMRGRMSRPMGPYPPPAHRDLINIPVMGMSMDPMAHQMMHPMRGMHMGRGRGRGGFDHSRLGFKSARNYANCSLEVKKIPREQNNIMDLNSHFSKFGKIINIQINFENDQEAALVTFSAPAEAQAAYRSTEAVLNNRFIRVFWHSKEKENEEAGEEPSRVPIKDRLGGIEGEDLSDSQEKILVSGNNITKTVYNSTALLAKKTDAAAEKIQAVEAIKKSQEMLAAQTSLKKKEAEKRKEAMKIISDVRKRKQDMLDEQIKAQKKLISKLETGKSTMKKEEISECMALVKAIQANIEKIKKELEEGAPRSNMSSSSLPQKTKEETEREMLDAELELYNKEQEGGDTVALQKKISDLRARARALGIPYRGRGFRGGNPRGYNSSRGGRGASRGGMRALRTVDRRPTRVRVTGFPVARIPEILPHFSQFGTINEYETDTVTPAMVLNFETRKSAELAMNNGKVFGESELEIVWVNNSDNPENNISSNGDGHHSQPLGNGGTMEDDELGDILANEILLTYEEDDDEGEEAGRSWRR